LRSTESLGPKVLTKRIKVCFSVTNPMQINWRSDY
jgi:hypothetical protein